MCPVCDSTDYVLRQGEYFCRMCNTQSQELGLETVMDEETVPLSVQGSQQSRISLGGRSRAGRRGRQKRRLQEAVRWGTVEGEMSPFTFCDQQVSRLQLGAARLAGQTEGCGTGC